MLQELKVEKNCLNLALQIIIPRYHSIVAYPLDGKGGSTLLIHLDFDILNYGTIPRGLVAWAHINGHLGEFHSTSIYGVGSSIDFCTL